MSRRSKHELALRDAQHPYPEFAAALRAIGDTSPKLAAALGISQRQASEYLAGRALPRVKVLRPYPHVLMALASDFAAQRAQSASAR